MPQPTTLYEYYKQKGEVLPKWQERGKTYESLGLGTAVEYAGTAEQNVSLLGALVKPPVSGEADIEKPTTESVAITSPTQIKNKETGEITTINEGSYDPQFYDEVGGGVDIGLDEDRKIVVTSDEQDKIEEGQEIEEEEKTDKIVKDQDKEIVERTQAKAIAQLKTDLAALGFEFDPATGKLTKRPALPTYVDDFEALRSEHGLAAIETQLNNLNTEIRDSEAALRLGLNKEGKRLAPMGMIRGEQAELKRQAQEDLDFLNRRKQTLIDEYNTKVSLINTTMKLTQMDYQTAVADYDAKFTQAVNFLNILEGRTDRAAQEENRQRDDERGNLTIMSNLIKVQNWEELNAEMQSQIQ